MSLLKFFTGPAKETRAEKAAREAREREEFEERDRAAFRDMMARSFMEGVMLEQEDRAAREAAHRNPGAIPLPAAQEHDDDYTP